MDVRNHPCGFYFTLSFCQSIIMSFQQGVESPVYTPSYVWPKKTKGIDSRKYQEDGQQSQTIQKNALKQHSFE